MKKIGAFFKLVRWPNLLITAVTMCLVYHCLLKFDSSVSFTLLVISMVLVQAGGYVINDIFDKEIDAVNKPEKKIVGHVFTEKQCHVFYTALTVIGLGCALAASIMALGGKFISVFACMVLLVCLLYSYSSRYKRKLVIGNLIVSLSVAFAVFVPWLFEMLNVSHHEQMIADMNVDMSTSLRFVLIYTGFAFLMTLLRELVKDMEDMKGDSNVNCRTIPIVWGITPARIIAVLLCFVTFLLICIGAAYMLNGFGLNITSYMLYTAGTIMLLFEMVGSVNSFVSFHFQSIMLKISMLIGVLSMIFI